MSSIRLYLFDFVIILITACMLIVTLHLVESYEDEHPDFKEIVCCTEDTILSGHNTFSIADSQGIMFCGATQTPDQGYLTFKTQEAAGALAGSLQLYVLDSEGSRLFSCTNKVVGSHTIQFYVRHPDLAGYDICIVYADVSVQLHVPNVLLKDG